MYSLGALRNKKFCVVGDMIVDHYRFLKPSKLSPEAPVVIFKPDLEEYRPGGAGNVANNLGSLGGQVRLCVAVGGDWPSIAPIGNYIAEACVDPSNRTTVKERLVTKTQQIARIDLQARTPLAGEIQSKLVEKATEAVKWADVVVFSDYDHGTMTCDIVAPLITAAKGKPIVVDSKAADTISKYKHCTIALPNNVEARHITRLDDFDDMVVAKYMLKHMQLEALGLTLGKHGIMLCASSGTKVYQAIGDISNEVVDVTGAGDTVTALVAAGISLGMPYHHSIVLANLAASIVVQKRGVATASIGEVLVASGRNETELSGMLEE
jgi:D-beta-D-heptose 7-phosphate kinase/D-beta-D-heptose 1-phosphate adenosyltransferase